MTSLGTPLSPSATRVLLLGSGELGKEVAIELQRFGVEVIAVDRYADAPAMQVAHRSHVIDMLDPQALRAVIAREQPHLVVPEIEAIHTQTLVELEAAQGLRVIPTARAARLTMDREGIRRLAAETLGLTRWQTLRHVVLPPAIERVFPALTSQYVLLMLASSICSQISAEELTAVANRVQSDTFRSVETYLIVAVGYLALSLVMRAVFWLVGYFAFPRRRRLGTPL